MLRPATVAGGIKNGMQQENVHGKVLLQEGRKSVIKHTKNEPVVSRNIYHRACDPG